MNTLLNVPQNEVVIDYGIAKEELTICVDADLQITIEGIDDKSGYKLADTRRKDYVKLRNAIDKRRKELNAEARQHIKHVNDSAEELQQLISEGETHVTKLVDEIDAEVQRARQKAFDETFNVKNAKLMAVGLQHPRLYIDSLCDAAIDMLVNEKIEIDRLKKDEAARQAAAKADADRLAEEEKARQQIAAEQLAADRAVLNQQRAEFEAHKAEQMQRQQAEAAAERLIDLQRKQNQADELDRQHFAAVRPDREKLLAFVLAVEGIPLPNVSPLGAELLQEVRCAFRQTIDELRAIIG